LNLFHLKSASRIIFKLLTLKLSMLNRERWKIWTRIWKWNRPTATSSSAPTNFESRSEKSVSSREKSARTKYWMLSSQIFVLENKNFKTLWWLYCLQFHNSLISNFSINEEVRWYVKFGFLPIIDL
jgi:hypothetical protein